MTQLLLQKECVIRRPVEVVRAHFMDFDHHIAHNVHKSIEYTLLEYTAQGQRLRSRLRVLGLPKTDEIVVRLDDQGVVEQKFVKGDFAGGTLRVQFRDAGSGATHLTARFDVPLRGLNRLLKPLVKRVLSKLTDQAIEEDRVDLEQWGYAPKAPPPGSLAAE